jgi:class 3 adenylate cyclase
VLVESFSERRTDGVDAVVAIFDLADYSSFFVQPDTHLFARDYLNVVLEAFNGNFRPGRPFWMSEHMFNHSPYPLPEPSFAKFMGDGGLYIWTSNDVALDSRFAAELLNRLYVFREAFLTIAVAARARVPLVRQPSGIRFGIARGTVYPLFREGDVAVDYVGFPINLAARLQSYCRELGFVASARLRLSHEDEQRFRWLRRVATTIRSFEPEYVYVDEQDLKRVPPDSAKEKFLDRVV